MTRNHNEQSGISKVPSIMTPSLTAFPRLRLRVCWFTHVYYFSLADGVLASVAVVHDFAWDDTVDFWEGWY